MRKRILLVEDDPWQVDSISENVSDLLRLRGIAADFTVANSEWAAGKSLADAANQGKHFDAYIVDLMMPWSQEEAPVQPDNPAVREQGPLIAGWRVIEQIQALQDQRRAGAASENQATAAPIILYTIGTNADALESHSNYPGLVYLPKAENDKALAYRLAELLSPSRTRGVLD